MFAQTGIYRTTVMLQLQSQNVFFFRLQSHSESFAPIAGQQIPPEDLVIGPRTGIRTLHDKAKLCVKYSWVHDPDRPRLTDTGECHVLSMRWLALDVSNYLRHDEILVARLVQSSLWPTSTIAVCRCCSKWRPSPSRAFCHA